MCAKSFQNKPQPCLGARFVLPKEIYVIALKWTRSYMLLLNHQGNEMLISTRWGSFWSSAELWGGGQIGPDPLSNRQQSRWGGLLFVLAWQRASVMSLCSLLWFFALGEQSMDFNSTASSDMPLVGLCCDGLAPHVEQLSWEATSLVGWGSSRLPPQPWLALFSWSQIFAGSCLGRINFDIPYMLTPACRKRK